MVDHKRDARFVVNTHSIHNYKSILAVTPPHLLMPSTGIDLDTVALRMRAAQLIRGEDNVTHPTGTDGNTSNSLPFDRTHAKSRAAPRDTNMTFAGPLSSQSKSTLMAMAAALSIPASEKTQKQELALKIQNHLDANPDVRNSVRFAQVAWRSATRTKTIPASSTSSPGTLHGATMPLPQQVLSHIPSSHAPCPPFQILQTHISTAGLPAIVDHAMPSTSLHTLQRPFFYHPLSMTPSPYLSPQIPPTNGLQHDLRGHVLSDIQPSMRTYHLAPVTHQGHYPGAPDNIYRATN